MVSLLQLYDPLLYRFTFQDYQLEPMLEEYAYILDVKIPSCTPFICFPEIIDYVGISKALYLNLSDVRSN